MSSDYVQLLDATLRHLEKLRAEGVEFIPVKAATLSALTAPIKAAPAQRSGIQSQTSSVSSASSVAALPPAPPAVTTTRPPVARSVTASSGDDPFESFDSAAPVSDSGSKQGPSTGRPSLAHSSGEVFESSILPVTPTQPKGAPSQSLSSPETLAPLPARLEPAAKEDAMRALRQRVMACVRCPNLVATRRSVVFGEGNIHARLLFIGEAPGMDEDLQGEPFVGAAGSKLTQMIQAMGLTRQDVFIANVLKCRPDTPAQVTGNRKPTSAEMSTCLPYLQEQVELIQPEVIVALGATAVEGLFGQKQVFIGRVRGRWQPFRGIPVMPTYHPSYILRSEDNPAEAMKVKRMVWEDLLAAMERLQLPISAKQRGYFKKPA